MQRKTRLNTSNTSVNQISPVSVRQLAVALLIIILASALLGVVILQRAAKRNLQVYSGQLPADQSAALQRPPASLNNAQVIRSRSANAAANSGTMPDSMSFNLPPVAPTAQH